jgi:hypothetical protein
LDGRVRGEGWRGEAREIMLNQSMQVFIRLREDLCLFL